MLILPTTVYAAPEYINFQASIRKPDGTRLEAPDVSFRLKYLNAAASCTVYVEDFQNHSMVGSGGSVSLLMGSGAKVFPVTATSLYSTFNNATSNSMACVEGGTYSPTLSTERRLVTVEFYYSGSNGLQIISNIEVNSVPYAMHATNADQLAGFAANLYTKFSDFTTCTGGDVLTYNGTAFSCVPAGGTSQWSNNAANIYFNTGSVGIGTNTPGASLDVRGVISNGASDFILGSHDGRNQGANPNQRALVHHDSTAGYFDDALIVNYAGDFEGGTYLEGPRVVLPTGNLGVGVTNPLHKIDVNGDINVTGNFKVNGVNITTGGGTVTSVTASPPLLSSGGNTPDISMPAATASVDGYLSAADFTAFNNKVSSQWTNNLTDIYFNTGNVGIGTTAPGFKLDVQTSSASSTGINVRNSNAAGYSFVQSGNDVGNNVYISSNGTLVLNSESFRPNGGTLGSDGPGGLSMVAGNASGPMSFFTGGDLNTNERMRITSTGDVGVGVTSPAYKLDVAGDVNVTGNFKVNGTNVPLLPSPWLMNASDTYFNTGNVGIGTNAPTRALEVHSASTNLDAISVRNTAVNGYSSLGFHTSAGALAGSWGYANASTLSPLNDRMFFNAVNKDMIFSVDGGSTGSMFIQNTTGNVGLGTSNPNAHLTIGDGSATDSYAWSNRISTSNHLDMYSSMDSGVNAVYAGSGLQPNTKTYIIGATGAGTAGWNQFALDLTTGNLGIGTNTPAHKLDVVGDVNVTGNFKVNGVNISNTPSPWLMNVADTYFNTGNVGVGTNTPLNKLHVYSTNSADGLSIDGNNDPGITLRSNGTIRGYAPVVVTANTSYFADALAGDMAFRSETNNILFGRGSGNATMAIVGNNVGIGTTTPSAPLSVVIKQGNPAGLSFLKNDVAGSDAFFNFSNATSAPGFFIPIFHTKSNHVGTEYANGFIADTNTDGVGQGVVTSFMARTSNTTVVNRDLFDFSNWAPSEAGGATAMRIKANGNIGIGTITPAYKLDVAGDVNVTGSFKINGTDINNTPSPWLMNGSNTYFNTGNVGVGTANPVSQLNVAGTLAVGDSTTSGNSIRALTLAATNAVMRVLRISPDINLAAPGVELLHRTSADGPTDEWWDIYTNTSGFHFRRRIAGDQDFFNINTLGNIGVGTTTPTLNTSGKFVHVHESSTGAAAMHFTNSTTQSGAADGFTVGKWDDAAFGGGAILWNYEATPLVFGTDATEKMRIDSVGRVGIGITNPAYSLDVTGDVNVTGNFKINGTNITSSQWTTTGADIYNSNAGNVGIGTAGAPLFKLDVNGSVRSTEYTFAVTPGDPAPTMTARLVPAGQGASLEKSELILFHSNDGYNSSGPDQITLRAPALSFQTYNDALVNDISNNNGYNERMYVTPNGEVGINTTTPRAKFEVNGTVVMKAAVDNPTASVNFDTGNLQYTALDCQAFALNNLKDGGSYMFVVQGTNTATCSFTAFSDNGVTPLIVKLPPDHGATTNGKETIYNIVVMGSKVYFSWTPGY